MAKKKKSKKSKLGVAPNRSKINLALAILNSAAQAETKLFKKATAVLSEALGK